MRKVLLATVGAMVLAAAAWPAAAMPDEAWDAFLGASYGAYRDDDEPLTWEDRLFEAGKDAAGEAAAVARFGQALGATPEQARSWADAIAAAAIMREVCERKPDCEAWDGFGYDAIIAAGLAEPSGQLLESVGRNLTAHYGPLRPARFIEAISTHPKRLEIMKSLYDYGAEDELLVALFVSDPAAPKVLEALQGGSDDVSGPPDKWDGWLLAALEGAAARLDAEGASIDARAVYAQAILSRYLALGLDDQAVVLWRSWPESMRQALPLAAAPCADDDHEPACATRQTGRRMTDELAAALWLRGDAAGARAVLAQADARLGKGRGDDAGAHGAVVEAIDRRISAADLYSKLVVLDRDPASHSSEAGGWAFASYGPASRELVGARIRDAGYGSIADLMAKRSPYHRYPSDRGEGQLAGMQGLLSPYADRQRLLKAQIDAAWEAAGGDGRSRPTFEGSYRPEGWTEARLPAGVTAWTAPAASDDESWTEPRPVSLPEGIERPPVPMEAIIRHQVIGGESVILFASSEFDLSGEIPAPGLWMARTEQGRWREPSYLGMQQHFPYVPTEDSKVPLIEHGRVRIETLVREIDPRSITFPPVGLSLLREEDGVMIERDLADVERDGDGDGLTDIAERRLLLDPASPDSDGDGLPDGADPMPLTARIHAERNARFELAAAIIHSLTGYDAGAIVMPAQLPDDPDQSLALMAGAGSTAPRMATRIIVGDPAMFAGLDLPFRLLVYTPEQAARMANGPAPFMPPTVDIYSSLDNRRHLVVWSASWVGGQFSVTCADPETDSCEVKEISNWIT